MQALQTQRRDGYLRLLPFMPVLVALIALIFILQRNMQAVKTATEQDTLMPIAQALGLPSKATKSEVCARLEALSQDHEVARRVWIATQVGADVNWDQIFHRIEQMQPEEQAKALQVIASEYHLPVNTPLAGIKKNVVSRGSIVQAPIRLDPIPRPFPLMPTAD